MIKINKKPRRPVNPASIAPILRDFVKKKMRMPLFPLPKGEPFFQPGRGYDRSWPPVFELDLVQAFEAIATGERRTVVDPRIFFLLILKRYIQGFQSALSEFSFR
jgi:hypothetical protein